MAPNKEFPLSLVIKAVDKATAPLREINAKIAAATAPARKLNNSFRALAKEAGLPKLAEGFAGVGRAASKVGREAFSLGAKIVGVSAAAAFAFHRIVKGAVDAGDELDTMAKRVGLGVDAYASLRFAADQADVDQEQFNSALDQFNKRLGEAKANTGPLLGFLQKVSPVLAGQVKNAKSTEEAFSLMTDAMSRIEDPGKRAALAAAAFGRSGLQMGNFLHQGSAAIQEQQAAYMKLTGSQAAFAKNAGDLDNAMKRAEQAFDGAKNAALGALFPALTALTTALTDVFVKNRPAIEAWGKAAGAALSAWFSGGGLERLIDGVKRLSDQFMAAINFVGGFKTVAVAIGAFMAGPLISSVYSLGTAIYSLGVALAATPLGWAIAGVAALAAGFVFLYTKFQVVRDAVDFVFTPLKKAVGDLWTQLKSLFDVLGPVLLPVLQAVATVLGGAVMGAIMLLIKPLEWMVKLLGMVVEGWTNIIGFAGAGIGALGDFFGFGGDRPKARAVPPGGSTRHTNDAKVTIEIPNAPKGTRVTPDSSGGADIDLAVGYSMAGAM